MIFHKPTRTAIFTPTKTGSVSLRLMVAHHRDFELCHGPAPWNRRQLTPHVASADVDHVDDLPIERRYLLFREPTARVISVWKHSYHRGECGPWPDWIQSLEAVGGWQSQRSYCPEPDGIIRTSQMEHDLSRLSGQTFAKITANATPVENPPISVADLASISLLYADDFHLAHRELFRLLTPP